jgi:cyclopropane fatty-acyl-phospholipid synthase-like methyltransferase
LPFRIRAISFPVMMIAAGPDPRRYAPATLRNRGPILDVLRQVLPAAGTVLEIASGSGEHAVFFAEALPDLMWQPTDPDPDNRASIRAWIAETGVTNVTAPADLDAAARAWPVTHADAIVCINMIHISPWAATLGLLAGAGRTLPTAAPLYLYGPYLRHGRHTAPSNEDFDQSLRAQNPEWGVRDLDEVSEAAAHAGLTLAEVIEMPANNLSVVFRRG